jgi:hypothetical protein
MDIFMVLLQGNNTIDSEHFSAEKTVNGDASTTVNANGGAINPATTTKQTLVNDQDADKSTYTINIKTAGAYALYTQHMNWEFASTFLENSDNKVPLTELYVFATEARDYVLEDTLSGAEQAAYLEKLAAEGDSGRKPTNFAEVGQVVLDAEAQILFGTTYDELTNAQKEAVAKSTNDPDVGLSTGATIAIVVGVIAAVLAGAAIYVMTFKDQSEASMQHRESRDGPQMPTIGAVDNAAYEGNSNA